MDTVQSTSTRSLTPRLQQGKRLLAAFAVLVLSGLIGSTAASAAHADPISAVRSESSQECFPAAVLVNSGGVAPFQLQRYGVDANTGSLSLINSVTLDRSFGDIALIPDSSILYGINFAIPMNLYVIDQTTGASTEIAPLTLPDGTPVPSIGLNSLSVAPDGRLFIGGNGTSSIWTVDTVTGELELAPVAFPALADGTKLASGGDFLTIGDGLLLGLGTSGADDGYLVVFDVNEGTSVVVGSVPKLFGAAQSAGHIYLAGADGNIYSLDEIPMTPSEAPVSVSMQLATGLGLYGATSSQDATGCQTASMAFEKVLQGNADEDSSGSVTEGDTLSYVLTATNTGETGLTNVVVADDLTGGSITCEVVALGGTCVLEVTYVVTKQDTAAGEIVNIGTAQADGLDPLDSTVTVPVVDSPARDPQMSFLKMLRGNADEDGSGDVTEMDTLSYTLTATNTGEVELTNVVVADDLTGDSITCSIVVVDGECILEVSYRVTTSDAAAGKVVNVGTAVSAETDPLESSVTVPVLGPEKPGTTTTTVTPTGKVHDALAVTGTNSAGLASGLTIILLVLGAAAVIEARRRQTEHE